MNNPTNERDDWPQFQGGPRHTGAPAESNIAIPQQGVEQRWHHERAGSQDKFTTRPVISSHFIYLGLYEDTSHHAIHDHYLVALDRGTGSMHWSFGLGYIGSTGGISGPPAIANKTVFITSPDRGLYAIEAATGHPRWRFETQSANLTAPVVADGIVYVSDKLGGVVYALDAENGGVHWQYENANSPSIPAATKSTVYIGEDGNQQRVIAIDLDTGDRRWTFQADSDIQASPTVYEDTVYVGDNDGKLYALAADDGECHWVYQTRSSITGAPAVQTDTIYVASDDGRLHAIAAEDGQPSWSQQLANISGPPIPAGGVVNVSAGNSVSALDTETGDILWSSDASSGHLAVGDGVIYAGSSSAVTALEGSTEDRIEHRGA